MNTLAQISLVVGLIMSAVGIFTDKSVCRIPPNVIELLGAWLTVCGAGTLIVENLK